MKAIEVKNLVVRFGENVILDNINFEIEEKSITALIGPNGSGKSTLLKAIIGLIPFEGTIKIFGKPNSENRHLLGYMPQSYYVDKFLPLNVEEFLNISLVKKKLSIERIKQILEDIDVLHYLKKELRKLSGGQLQRVLFAKTLLNEPKILLLDEPVSEIDVSGQKEFYSIIRYLNEKNRMTILIVTHEITIVHHFATNVLCLNKKLVCNGPVSILFNEELIKKLYGREILVYPFNKPPL